MIENVRCERCVKRDVCRLHEQLVEFDQKLEKAQVMTLCDGWFPLSAFKPRDVDLVAFCHYGVYTEEEPDDE